MDKETQQSTTSSTAGTTNNRHSTSKNSTRNRQQSGSNAQSKRRLHGEPRVKSHMAVSSDASSNNKKQSPSEGNCGASDGSSKDLLSNNDTPSPASATSNGSGGNSASGRRERKQKFDVKKLLNIRGNNHGVAVTAAAAGETAKAPAATAGGGTARKNRKSEGDGTPDSANPTSTSPSPSPSPATMNHKTRRSGRVAAAAAAKTSSPSAAAATAAATTNGEADAATPSQQQKATATHVVCNDPHLKDSEHSIVLTGKRERKRKRFWDDEQAEAGAANISATNTSPAPTPSKLAKKSDSNKSGGGANSVNSSTGTGSGKSSKAPASAASAAVSEPQSKSKRRDRRSSGLDSAGQKRRRRGGGGDEAKENSAAGSLSSSSAPASVSATPVKLNGKTSASALGYLQFDLSLEPAMIAKQMVEGVNIPGPGVPIPVDSTNLPEGWEKRVIQRGIGITKGKWDVFIQSPAGKSFRSKIELQRFFEEKSLPFSSEAFDFSLDDHLKKLRQIWKQHIVIPQQKAAAAAAALAAAQEISGSLESAVSPAKSVSSSSPPSAAAPTAPLTTATGDSDGRRPSSPLNAEDGHGGNASDQLGVESETGQGLRCSIAGCRKLFRNDRLLHMHVKHYHPEVFGSLVQQSGALSVEDLAANRTSLVDELVAGDGAEGAASSSSPSSPATASSSRKSSQEDGASNNSRKRKLSQGEKARVRNGSGPGRGGGGGERTSCKRRPSQSVDPDHRTGAEGFSSHTRSRNDSILSVGSESSAPAAAAATAAADETVFPPSTPPTFRMSKRRQAQLKKKLGGSGTSPPTKGRNKEDTRFMEEYMTFIGGNKEPPSCTAAAAIAASLPTTPVPNARAASPGSGGAAGTAEPTSSAPPSYPPSEMDASVASEHLTSEEVVNCTCKRTEEDGLMIQCDICLCWQHGDCLGIDEEDQVPDKHVCSICKEPKAGRTEQRFSIDQDWLKEGKLQTVAPGEHSDGAPVSLAASERESAFRKLSEMMADLSNLSRVLHSLRMKLWVASQSNNGKVFMWSSPWNDDQPAEQGAVVKKEPVEEEMPLGAAATDLQQPAGGDLFDAQAVSAVVGEASVSSGLADGRTEAGGSLHDRGGLDGGASKAEASHEQGVQQERSSTSTPNPPSASAPTQSASSQDEVPAAPAPGAASSSPAPLGQAETSFPPTPSAGAGDAEVDDAHLLNGGGDEVNGATPNATFAAVKDEVFSESGSNNITPPKAQQQEQQGAGGGATTGGGPPLSVKAADTPNSLSPKSNKDDGEDGSTAEIKGKRENGFDNSPPVPPEKVNSVGEAEVTPPPDRLRDSAAPVAALTPPDENDLDTTDTTVTEEDAEVAAAAVAAHEDAAMAVDDNIHIDPSMIPSVSEVEQLLPSIIQSFQQEDVDVPTAAVVTGPPSAPQPLEEPMPPASAFAPALAQAPLPIIPEQKRIDKDECRLNLLEHIEKMQNEVDSLLGKVEVNLSAVEGIGAPSSSQAPHSFPASVTAAAVDKMSARTKALAQALIHDVSTARKLVGAL